MGWWRERHGEGKREKEKGEEKSKRERSRREELRAMSKNNDEGGKRQSEG